MAYYKAPNPDWIASPVGIAKRPFIAGGLVEWPPQGYIGPSTNYKMPRGRLPVPPYAGCGACGGFGDAGTAAGVMASQMLPGMSAPGWAAGLAAAEGAGLAPEGADPTYESDAGYDALLAQTEAAMTAKEQSFDVQEEGAAQGAQPPVVPAPVPAGSLAVPILLGLGVLGLMWWSSGKKTKKTRRNSPRRRRARR